MNIQKYGTKKGGLVRITMSKEELDTILFALGIAACNESLSTSSIQKIDLIATIIAEFMEDNK